MIQIIELDLFKSDAAAYLHVANCFCQMNSGVAAGMKKNYPEAIDADNKTYNGDINKLGTFSYALAKNGKHIYNLYGQYRYGNDKRRLNYEALYTSLDLANKDFTLKGINSIALPFNMGCGLAGGNWEIVSTMLDVVFRHGNIDVYICKQVS